MSSPDLRRLWKLHQVDEAIVEVRKQAEALDPGRVLMSEIKTLEAKHVEVGGEYKALHSEQLDLELSQKSIDDKLKKIDKELYGGKLVNPREIDALQKEIEILKRQRSAHDDRLLELMELVPPAEEKAKKIETAINVRKKALLAKQHEAAALKTQLAARFKALQEQRPEVAKLPSADYLARYEAVRKRTDGIAMAEVVGKRSCGACGMLLAERVIVNAAEGRLTSCEACHRILYYTEGVV
ncbi:MAG: zinc ribbon domain-containing protein [Fimbriimonas sp.]